MCPIKFGPGRRGDFNIELAEYIDDLLLSMGSLVSRTVRRIEVKDILIAGEAGVTDNRAAREIDRLGLSS